MKISLIFANTQNKYSMKEEIKSPGHLTWGAISSQFNFPSPHPILLHSNLLSPVCPIFSSPSPRRNCPIQRVKNPSDSIRFSDTSKLVSNPQRCAEKFGSLGCCSALQQSVRPQGIFPKTDVRFTIAALTEMLTGERKQIILPHFKH